LNWSVKVNKIGISMLTFFLLFVKLNDPHAGVPGCGCNFY